MNKKDFEKKAVAKPEGEEAPKLDMKVIIESLPEDQKAFVSSYLGQIAERVRWLETELSRHEWLVEKYLPISKQKR